MEIKQIFNRIESIISDNIKNDRENEVENEDGSIKKNLKDIFYLLLDLLLNILKAPFKLVARILRDELIASVKKDAKLYMFILLLSGVLFVFFSVIWLFISVAVGVYFYKKGNTVLLSIIYSIVFQTVSFIFVDLIAFIASKKITSLKLIKKMNNTK